MKNYDKNIHRFKTLLFALSILVLIMLNINPIYPDDIWLQHLGTVGLYLIIGFDLSFRVLTLRAYIALISFTCLHLVAARWLYTYVPYDEWIQQLFGVKLNSIMGWQRNHFDRLVHFSYGFCFSVVVFDCYHMYKRESRQWASLFTLEFIMATSLIYEWIEWALTFSVPASLADNYLGQQGDPWDAHKDMLLATIGSLCYLIMLYITKLKTPNKISYTQ